MKKCFVLVVFITLAYMLCGESIADSTGVKPNAKYAIWAFGEIGGGSISEVALLAPLGGIAFEYNQHFRVSAYKLVYTERTAMFNPIKYDFVGKGAQIGYVWPVNKFKLSTSIGYEFGDIRIGEGPLEHGFLGEHYERYRYESIFFTPLSFEGQYMISHYVAFSGRFYHAFNKRYPVSGFGLGLCVGKL